MNKKEITITAPDGQVIDYNETNGTIKFVPEPLDIMDRIKTFADVCKDQNRNIEDYYCSSQDPDEIIANATKKALLISRCFNDGKEADWGNSNQSKYFIWWRYTPSSGWSLSVVVLWYAFTHCGARLAFLNRKHAEYCAAQFKDVYDQINNLIPQANV
jgi:hypothetical protein